VVCVCVCVELDKVSVSGDARAHRGGGARLCGVVAVRYVASVSVRRESWARRARCLANGSGCATELQRQDIHDQSQLWL
jgi:hypothetical protein